MTIKPIALSACVLICVSSLPARAAGDASSDPVAASFNRLLNHEAAVIGIAVPADSGSESDPLRNRISAVLWEEPTYHLPVRYAYFLSISKRKK